MPPPFFPPGSGGTIINNPSFPAARILNASNVAHNVAKMLAVPSGWALVDGYSETFARDDTSAVAFFVGPWSNRDLFYDWCLGHALTVQLPSPPSFDQPGQMVVAVLHAGGYASIINQQPTTPFLSRNPPAQHWRWPWMYAVSCELVRGQGAWGPDPQGCLFDNYGNPLLDGNGKAIPAPHSIAYYDSSRGPAGDDLSALVKVTYRSTEGLYEVRTDAEMVNMQGGKGELERWVVREPAGSVQFLPLTGTPLTFYEGPQQGKQIPENAKGIPLFVDELTYIWVDVPDVPWDAIRACVGRTNAQPFDGARGWPTYAAGTLLMQAPQRKRHRSPVGRVTWDITYRFLFRDTGWNKYPAGDTATGANFGFWGASFDGTAGGPKAFGTADFNALFVPPPPQQYQ